MTATVNGITIRPAEERDVATIAALIMHGAAVQTRSDEEIAREAAHPAYLDAFREVAASAHDSLFVAEHDGAVVGTYQITLIPGIIARGRKRAKLESVHVSPAMRGRGVGAAMIRHAIEQARAGAANMVELSSNKSRLDAHRFYRTLGFAQSHEGFKLEL